MYSLILTCFLELNSYYLQIKKGGNRNLNYAQWLWEGGELKWMTFKVYIKREPVWLKSTSINTVFSLLPPVCQVDLTLAFFVERIEHYFVYSHQFLKENVSTHYSYILSWWALLINFFLLERIHITLIKDSTNTISNIGIINTIYLLFPHQDR